jgi:hypothetical protein
LDLSGLLAGFDLCLDGGRMLTGAVKCAAPMRRHVSSSPIEALRPLIVDLKQQAPICELRGVRTLLI